MFIAFVTLVTTEILSIDKVTNASESGSVKNPEVAKMTLDWKLRWDEKKAILLLPWF